MQPQQPQYRVTRKQVIFGALLLIVTLIAWMISRYSYIEVKVPSDNKSSEITYRISKNGEIVDTTSNTSNSYKKLVTKGDYEVVVESNNQTSINLATTTGFLQTTEVTANLQPKKRIEFVGDEPRPCMYLTKVGLLSYGCGDQVVDAYYHTPATTNLPTYTRQLESIYDGRIEGSFGLEGKDYIAIQGPSLADGNEQPPQAAYQLSGSLETGKALPLKGLKEDTSYNITNYKTGLLAVSDNVSEALYLPNLEATAEPIDISDPNTTRDSFPYDIAVNDNTIIVGFVHDDSRNITYEDSEETPKLDSSIVVISNDQKRTFNFDKLYDEIKICGPNTICLLADQRIHIYDISEEKPKLKGVIGQVDEFDTHNSTITANRVSDVISFNTETMSGHQDYSYGALQPCGLGGINDDGNYYLLCVTNRRGEQSAIKVTSGIINPIDGYVDKILEIPEVEKVSAFGNIIYISPNLGEYKYNPSTNRFEYDQEIKKTVNSKIREVISKLNAGPQFKFINPLDN